MQQVGFVDLRINSADSDEAKFWPGFTDIMTVIVLIFIMTMLSLMARNMGLLDELAKEIALARAATAQAELAMNINAELDMRMRSLEEESTLLRLQLVSAGEEHNRTLSQLYNSKQANAQLEQSNSLLTTELSDIKFAYSTALDEKDSLIAFQDKLKLHQSRLEKSRNKLKNRNVELAKHIIKKRKAQAKFMVKYKKEMVELDQLSAVNVYCMKMGEDETPEQKALREKWEEKMEEERKAEALKPYEPGFFE